MEEHNGIASLPLPNPKTPNGLWLELVATGIERIHNHAVSPDGKRVAFYWDRNGTSDLWTIRLDDDAAPNWPNRITFGRMHTNWWEDEPPIWSPDSEWLVYGAYVDDIYNLHVVCADGGESRLLTELNEDAVEPCFSPDGKLIAFCTYKGGASQLAIVPFDGGWVKGLTHGDNECSSPQWSPDGSRIVYAASPQHELRQTDLYSHCLESEETIRLTPCDGFEYWAPTFSPDGKSIAMLCNRSGFDEVWMMASDGSRLSQLSQINQDIEDYAGSSDGKRIVVVGSELGSDPLFVINIETGETTRLKRADGNYSMPRWINNRDAFVVGFDSPTRPPDLFWVDAANGEDRALTNCAPSVLKQFEFVTPKHIYYTSLDGWQIPAFLYEPREAASARGLPGVVYPHGGPNAQYDLSWDVVRQYFVAKGFAFVCPNYRGSTGYGRAFKDANILNWGVGDLNDCLAAADVLANHPRIDSKRLAIWGQSYGGYLSLLALSKDAKYRFRCGVSLYGDSHLKTSWARGDHSGRQDQEWQMGLPGDHTTEYELGSPLNFIKDIRAPVLILHGERDARVHPAESAQLVQAMRHEGKTFEYKTYPDEGHGFAHPENALDALQRIEQFLDWHLM
jgi:dipeptidyl aminopeptidase/acylaminoacyl peptidase